MVENDLELGKKLFRFFPELKKWLENFIPMEDLNRFVSYDCVDIEREKGIEVITCDFTIFTTASSYSFMIRKPDKNIKEGDIFCMMSGFDEYRDGLGSNDFSEGFYNEAHFNDIMKKIMRVEGFDTNLPLSRQLVSLDLVNFDGL